MVSRPRRSPAPPAYRSERLPTWWPGALVVPRRLVEYRLGLAFPVADDPEQLAADYTPVTDPREGLERARRWTTQAAGKIAWLERREVTDWAPYLLAERLFRL